MRIHIFFKALFSFIFFISLNFNSLAREKFNPWKMKNVIKAHQQLLTQLDHLFTHFNLNEDNHKDVALFMTLKKIDFLLKFKISGISENRDLYFLELMEFTSYLRKKIPLGKTFLMKINALEEEIKKHDIEKSKAIDMSLLVLKNEIEDNLFQTENPKRDIILSDLEKIYYFFYLPLKEINFTQNNDNLLHQLEIGWHSTYSNFSKGHRKAKQDLMKELAKVGQRWLSLQKKIY